MEMILAKQQGMGLDVFQVRPEATEQITKLREAGYLELVVADRPDCEEGYIAVDYYTAVGDKLAQSWCIERDKRAVQRQIDELKARLEATDYKVLKCYECSLIGEAMPYDFQAVHAERQALRDEINVLEALL